MKTLGLIGGMSWESTVPYYRTINQVVREQLGGLHSSRLLLHSADFDEIARLQRAGDWDALAGAMADAAHSLKAGGAQLLVICSNTMHRVADVVEATSAVPLLHIADPTGGAIRAGGFTRIGLLGTRFTMEQDFYRQRLSDRHGLEVLVPEADERELVHHVIYDELCQGTVRESSRAQYRRVMESLVARGAQGIILGCTEIGLLVGEGDASVPLFDTTALHARAAALAALA